MERIYLDNAATTALDPAVAQSIIEVMNTSYGNPSSIHTYGREAKSLIERARKQVAQILNAAPAEIFFTSGGTEADNTAIIKTVECLGIRRAITSKLEHHAVLHTLEYLAQTQNVELHFVDFDQKGHLDLEHLELLLKDQPQTLVSLMHANNEIGNILDINTVSEICAAHGAVFHTDTVQTIGHYEHDFLKTGAHFMVGAAHKFHGPKGIGFLYIKSGTGIKPYIQGGAQERNMRGGTENIYGIVGLAKALEIATAKHADHKSKILGLKKTMIDELKASIPEIRFNGASEDLTKSNYTVLNASFPETEDSDMLLFNLDINKIACSGGSACSSGSEIGSHVLSALQVPQNRANVRFSFGKFNQESDIHTTVKVLSKLYNPTLTT